MFVCSVTIACERTSTSMQCGCAHCCAATSAARPTKRGVSRCRSFCSFRWPSIRIRQAAFLRWCVATGLCISNGSSIFVERRLVCSKILLSGWSETVSHTTTDQSTPVQLRTWLHYSCSGCNNNRTPVLKRASLVCRVLQVFVLYLRYLVEP